MRAKIHNKRLIIYFLINIGVAFLYASSGLFGLSLLATSPGYATPIWIPSGIALGTVLIWGLPTLPGIFIGSFFINYYVSTHNLMSSPFSSSIGCIVAAGAVLQTVAGWAMIRKWIGLNNPLNQPNTILLFALLSGPLSCLVNATWSNTLLLSLDIVPFNQYLFAWVNWWIGDCIGVLIFTPIFLILFAKPYSIWHKRILPILIPLSASFLGIITIYLLVDQMGSQEQIWSVFFSGLLFCVLINVILFIIDGQKNIAQLQSAEKALALKFEENKNLLILKSAGEGIFGIDKLGNTLFINPAAIKLLGFKEEDLIGKSFHDSVQYKHSDGSYYPLTFSPIYHSACSTKTFHIRNEVFWRKDGVPILVEYISSPLIDNHNTIGAVVVFSDVTQQRETEIKLEKMAHYDALSGLPNRSSFLEKLTDVLAKAKLNQCKVAVCIIDIDNFKQINDSLGHVIGDEILKLIPAILAPKLSKMDYLARLGGDEFAIIIENVESIYNIKLMLKRLIETLNKPIEIKDQKINTSLSVGAAIYPLSGKSTEELIMNADMAMYKAKEQGKNTFVIFNDIISKQVKRRNSLDNEMRKAFEQDEFFTVYQPIVDAKSKALLGFEVLLRWASPVFGEVSTAEYIAIAEKNGLIHSLGEWILNRACLDYQKMSEAIADKNLFISVNISVLQLESEDFFSKITHILNTTQMNSHNLIFEITETGVMQQPENTIKLMEKITQLGIRFALDDFGVDYSSMQYLKMLPVSLLKIDQVFVKDLDSEGPAIVKAIIQLAHGLGIGTIAEGVETIEQYQLLSELDCEYIQGFYFAKPLRVEEIVQNKICLLF